MDFSPYLYHILCYMTALSYSAQNCGTHYHSIQTKPSLNSLKTSLEAQNLKHNCIRRHFVYTFSVDKMIYTVMGDECLQKFECRYATEKIQDIRVFWSGTCLLLHVFAFVSCSVRSLRHD